EEQFRMGVILRPDSALLHYNLGVALQLPGRTEEAAQHYREALRSLFRGLAGAALALDSEERGGLRLGGQLDRPLHHAGEARRLPGDDLAFAGIGHGVAGQRKGIGSGVDADIESPGRGAAVRLRAMAEPGVHEADAAGRPDGGYLLGLQGSRGRGLDRA